MIVRDPYWVEREKAAAPALTFFVDLDKPKIVPFGFGVPVEPPTVAKPKKKKKRK